MSGNSTVTAQTDNIENVDGANTYLLTTITNSIAFTVDGKLIFNEAIVGSGNLVVDMTSGNIDDVASVDSGILAEPITLVRVATTNCSVNNSPTYNSCGAIFSDIKSLTMSGQITPTANTDLDSTDSTTSITGPFSGTYTANNPNGNLILVSSANTSSTPNCTYTPSSSNTVTNASGSSLSAASTTLQVKSKAKAPRNSLYRIWTN